MRNYKILFCVITKNWIKITKYTRTHRKRKKNKKCIRTNQQIIQTYQLYSEYTKIYFWYCSKRNLLFLFICHMIKKNDARADLDIMIAVNLYNKLYGKRHRLQFPSQDDTVFFDHMVLVSRHAVIAGFISRNTYHYYKKLKTLKYIFFYMH